MEQHGDGYLIFLFDSTELCPFQFSLFTEAAAAAFVFGFSHRFTARVDLHGLFLCFHMMISNV